MPRVLHILLFVAVALPALAATPKHIGPERTTIAQLEVALSQAQGKADSEVAQQLSGLELTERLNSAKLARLKAALPGEEARGALLILADQSAFLPPPNDEILHDPAPEPAATRRMLEQIVNYVNTTLHHLPNFIASRETTGFEDRPQEDIQQETSVISLSYQPLHEAGKSSATVTYRDGQEVVTAATENSRQGDKKKQQATRAKKPAPPLHGLATEGEFGPILSTVLADALKGKISWSRWEKSAGAAQAVFYYTVPKEKSNYVVKFCCISGGVADGLRSNVFGERAGYHGEITFDPENGAIQRITLQAELPPGELVSKAGMLVEYGPVEIGGKQFICPLKSVSVLLAHTVQPRPGMHIATFEGTPKTFLNHVDFVHYRHFGTELRMLPTDLTEVQADPPEVKPANAEPAGISPK